MDLPDAAGRLQVDSEVRPARRNANAPAALGELTHDLPANEARAAEKRDDSPRRDQSLCHARLVLLCSII
jgi:hypothetical protein